MESNKTDIFIRGIENLYYIRPDEKFGIIESLKIFFFYFFLIIISKPRCLPKKVFIINGMMEAKKKDVTGGSYERVYARRFSSSLRDYRNALTIISTIGRKKRFLIMIGSVLSNHYGILNLGRWLEYNLLKEFIRSSNVSEAASFGHYDEFTVWLAELCYKKKIKYTMYQHGVVLDRITVPNKLYCDEVHVYNDYSSEVFENRIIRNKECKYYEGAFVSNVVFEEINKKLGKKYVGIIDQMFQDWSLDVIHKVMEIEDCIAVLLLHPLNQDERPYGLEESENLIITHRKYHNLDCVLTESSTMVLDYVYSGYHGKIVSTDITMREGFFRDFDITYIDSGAVKMAIETILD